MVGQIHDHVALTARTGSRLAGGMKLNRRGQAGHLGRRLRLPVDGGRLGRGGLVLQQRLVISDSTGIVTFPGGSLATPADIFPFLRNPVSSTARTAAGSPIREHLIESLSPRGMPILIRHPRVIHDRQHAPTLARRGPQITQPRRTV